MPYTREQLEDLKWLWHAASQSGYLNTPAILKLIVKAMELPSDEALVHDVWTS